MKFLKPTLSILLFLSGYSISYAQLTVNANQLKESISSKIIEDIAKKLISATEQTVINATYFNEILEPYKSLGIDPNNPAFAETGRAFYNEYKKAREKDATKGGNTNVKNFLKTKFKAAAMGMLDKDSQTIITDLSGLLKEAKAEIQKITDAVDHIGKQAADDPKTDISDMLAQYGLKGDWADRFKDYEGAWTKVKDKYGDYYTAYKVISKAMGQDRPGPKILALFELGEKFGKKIPIIGRLVEPMFKLGNELLKASGNLGKLLEANWNQGCVGHWLYNSTDNPYVNERARLFLSQFPVIDRACVVNTDLKAGIYADIYFNTDNERQLFFWNKGKWVKGTTDSNHNGLQDIRGLVSWLRANEHAKEAGELNFIIKAYNKKPGFTEFQKSSQEKIAEVASLFREISYRLRLCDGGAVEDLLMNQGKANFFYTLLDLSNRSIGWEDLKEFPSFFEKEALKKMIYYRYVRNSKDNRYRFDDMITALSKMWPVELDGRVRDKTDKVVTGATIEYSPSVRIFDGNGSCKKLTTEADGRFKIFLLLKKAEVIQITLVANKGLKKGDSETFKLDANTDKYIAVNLVLADDLEEKKKEIRDALSGLLGQAKEVSGKIGSLCRSSLEITGLVQNELVLKEQEFTEVRNQLSDLSSKLEEIKKINADALREYQSFDQSSVSLIDAVQNIENLSLAICLQLEKLEQANTFEQKKNLLTSMQSEGPRLRTALEDAKNTMQEARMAANNTNSLKNQLENQLDLFQSEIPELENLDALSSKLTETAVSISEIQSLFTELGDLQNQANGWLAKGRALTDDIDFILEIEAIYSQIIGLGKSDEQCIAKIESGQNRLSPRIEKLNNQIGKLNEDISQFLQNRTRTNSIVNQILLRINGVTDELTLTETYMERGRKAAIDGAFCITLAEDIVEKAKEVEVPNVVGMKISSAKAALSNLGLQGTLANSDLPDHPDKANKVISQSVTGGTKVKPGTAVALDYYGEFDKAKLEENTNCYPGSHAEWNADLEKVQCFCNEGLVWNKDRTKCVNPEELVKDADCSGYPGSYAVWNSQNNRVECWCPEGKKWNDTQTECIDDIDYLVANTNCYPGSYAKWNNSANIVECFCNQGLVWNSSKTACVDPQTLVDEADCSGYPGSYAAWNSQNNRVECWCPQGKVWNSSKTACITDPATIKCWPGSYAAYNPQTQRTECFCNEGLVWNSTNTACVDPQTLVKEADCSGYPGSYAAWNVQNKRVECWCPQGKVWNSTQTACVDAASQVQCWPGSYAAYNPQTQRTECYCYDGLIWNSTKTACIKDAGGGGGEVAIDEIVVTEQNVTISVWDHGCEDGDIVTLRINGQVFLNNHRLTNAPKTFNVTLPVGTNLLELVAIDSGTDCPPQADKSKTWNSAAIKITHAAKGGNQTWKLRQGAVTKANFIVRPQ